MNRFNALLAAVVTVAVSLDSLPTVSAQDKEDEIRLSAAEVLLDVIVTDGKGNPVTDLCADEVQVVEAGVPQDITSFALVKPGGGEPGAPAAPKAPVSIELSPFRGFGLNPTGAAPQANSLGPLRCPSGRRSSQCAEVKRLSFYYDLRGVVARGSRGSRWPWKGGLARPLTSNVAGTNDRCVDFESWRA